MKLPEEVVVSPQNSVTMVKLQCAGYRGTINTRPTTNIKTEVILTSAVTQPLCLVLVNTEPLTLTVWVPCSVC